MGETTVEDAAAAPKAKPTIVVPQRGSVDSLFTNGLGGLGFSPGPMTLVSSFFSDQGPFSFSQLLAGAMASPIAAKQGFQVPDGSGKEEKGGNSADERENSESDVAGYKRNRPMNLVVGQAQLQPESLSPLFMVPPGLSPSGLLNSPGFLSPLRSPFGMSHQQALAHVTAQAALSQSYMEMQAELQHPSSAAPAGEQPDHSSSAPAPTETLTPQQTNPVPTEPENLKIESSEVYQSDRKAACVAGEKPASDGYNWRKYGQKHVKASECPRSYYKCTHLNCPVRKKVERSTDGSISEIVYKGHHNHDPPQPNKRGRDSCAVGKTINSQVKPALASQYQTELNTLNKAGRVDTESVNFLETKGSFEHRPVANHNDEMEDNVIVLDDGDEPVAKRMTVDSGQSMKVVSHQTITESKIVVQTRSEVDLLDDGYKWRKYGQKVVKGNPHPRSYYRCTFAGCNVRKHVERSSADSKAVITTYEGKHNHEIPIGRYSNHGTASAGAQQLKGQKLGANNPLASREIDIGNDDQIPMTLHLKEEQINT